MTRPVLRTRGGRRVYRAYRQRWQHRVRHRPTVYQPPGRRRRVDPALLIVAAALLGAWLVMLASLIRLLVAWWTP